MKFRSALFSSAVGSIGGLTFARNASGMYVRNRTKPADPATGAQQNVRENWSNAVENWKSSLTPAQRQAWNIYARNTVMKDKLGADTRLNGLQQFMRTAAAGQFIPWDPSVAPTAPGIPEAPELTISSATRLKATITFGDPATNAQGGYLLIGQGFSVGQAINFFSGWYNYFTPQPVPTSPTARASFDLTWNVEQPPATRIFIQWRLFDAQGRVSSPRSHPIDTP